jgi:hypothetical protein
MGRQAQGVSVREGERVRYSLTGIEVYVSGVVMGYEGVMDV